MFREGCSTGMDSELHVKYSHDVRIIGLEEGAMNGASLEICPKVPILQVSPREIQDCFRVLSRELPNSTRWVGRLSVCLTFTLKHSSPHFLKSAALAIELAPETSL